MSNVELIDARIPLSQCRKAVEALHSHELRNKEKFEENQILPAKEQHVWLNVTLKKMPPTYKLKPHRIPIVHPLVDPRTTSICLITKDPQREYKDLLEAHNIKFISRVVGIEKLKGKFKPFEARRMLLKENGMFLADHRVIPLLPKLLGSKWFEAKKQPIPVCLTRKDLKGELERAISSTYLNQNRGTCTSIKIGKLLQKPSQIVENIKTAVPAITKVIYGGWDNIQNLNIKTNSSISLPIWSCTLDDAEGGRWHGLQAKNDSEETEGDKKNNEEEVSQSQKLTSSKSRKRSSSSDEEDERDVPRKKAKSTEKIGKTKETPPSIRSSKRNAKELETISPAKPQKPSRSTSSTTKSGGFPSQKDSTKAIDAVGRHDESKQKKKAQKSTSKLVSKPGDAPRKDDQTTADVPPPSGSSMSVQAETDGKAQQRDDRRKSKGTPTTTASSVMSILSKEKVTQKHLSSLLAKKKLLAKAKGGRSVKNTILGKKAGQE